MSSPGEFFQRYVNNRYNLLLLLIIMIAVWMSLLPEYVLQQVKQEILQKVSPVSTLVSRETHYSNLLKQRSEQEAQLQYDKFTRLLQEYDQLKHQMNLFTQSIQNSQHQSVDLENIPNPMESEHQKVLQKQEHLLQQLKQVKDYQLLHISQSVELQHNLTLLIEQRAQDNELLMLSLDRVQEKLQRYQHSLQSKLHPYEVYQNLYETSQTFTAAIQRIARKIKSVLEYDEKLCKDRVSLLKRHQVKFQKEEFEALIRETVNTKLQDLAHDNPLSDKPSMQYSETTCSTNSATINIPEKLDFALLSTGTEVVTSLTSPTYIPAELQLNNQFHKFAVGFGLEEMLPVGYLSEFESSHTWTEAVGLFYGVGSVQDVLRPDIRRGNCWPMNGTFGYFTIKLRDPIFLESISLDHIGKDEVRDWHTAPKGFKVFTAFDMTREWTEVLQDSFEPNRTTASRNYPIPSSEDSYGPVQFIRLNILSNHGHPDYTCIYRFRVHGELV